MDPPDAAVRDNGLRISLITTCLDEEDSIGPWISSLASQTRVPDEIVVVDGGSKDATLERLLAVDPPAPMRILVAPGANISTGRNIAIGHASGTVIAVADLGTVLERDWLERLTAPFEGADPPVDVSAGFFSPAGRSRFQRVLAAVITPRLEEISPDSFLPSSRSLAFRRDWWERVGGYPEWLRWSEDIVFDLELKAQGARFGFAPEAIAHWLPPDRFRGFLRQYEHYARGDGQWGLWPLRHALRYGFYAAVAGLVVLGRRRSLAWPLLITLFNSYLRRFFWRLRRGRPYDSHLAMAAAHAWVPAIVIGGDVAKMVGYARGRVESRAAGGRDGFAAVAAANRPAVEAEHRRLPGSR